MAPRTKLIHPFYPIIIFSILIITILPIPSPSAAGATAEAPSVAGRARPLRRKLTELTFFFHDLVTDPHPTSIRVIGPAAAAAWAGPNAFGTTNVMDNRLTEGSDLDSAEVGRARGIYVIDSLLQPFSLLMAMHLDFTAGKYNGSSLTVVGSNRAFSEVRELPVVAGTGLFRFATGYALLRTHVNDPRTRNACVQYTVFVMHY